MTTELPLDATCVVTTVFADLADAAPRVGLGSVTLSPFLPFTLSVRTSEARTMFFLYAAMISSIHRSGMKPDVFRSETMTLEPPNAIGELRKLVEGSQVSRAGRFVARCAERSCWRPLVPANTTRGRALVLRRGRASPIRRVMRWRSTRGSNPCRSLDRRLFCH